MWSFLLPLLCAAITEGYGLRLAAYVSSGGLHGEIRFEANNDYDDELSVRVRFALRATLQYPDQQWLWFITEFPVDYTLLEDRCDERHVGKSFVDLTEILGPLELPGNETGSAVIPGLSLTGENGLWGKGLLLKDTYSSRTICASLTVLEKNTERLAEVRFYGTIAGNVWFRWLGDHTGDRTTDTIVHADLHLVDRSRKLRGMDYTEHHWKIYVTDIFDSGKEKSDCNVLQTVFDPDDSGPGNSIGDIDARLGKIKVATNPYGRYKSSYRDPKLSLLPEDLLGPHRSLYLVVFHPSHEDSFLACAKINRRKTIIAKSILDSHGVKGEVTLTQETPFEPTWINVSLSAVNDLEARLRYATQVVSYRIHELPPEPAKSLNDIVEVCTTTKDTYDPLNVPQNGPVPPAGYGTQDQYAVGDLSGKLQGRKEGSYHYDILPGSAKLAGIYWDTYLPLSGIYSVVHRSLVLHRYVERKVENDNVTGDASVPWICGTLGLHSSRNGGQTPMSTGEVIFRYPIVGRILFRQPKDDPRADTVVIIEALVYADGSGVNNTLGHRWMIHQDPPGKDYYDWKDRCLSAGGVFDPYEVDRDPERCTARESSLCRLGDLTRQGTLRIAGRKSFASSLTRRLFTDMSLPLSGSSTIFGKSLVIYGDHGPLARGERLACSIIGRVYRRKAVARDWFGNGEETSIGGKIEFLQQTEYDVTNVEIDLEGLAGQTPVEIDVEFPCESTSLYGRWNPLGVNTTVPSTHSGEQGATVDRYEMGDLSGKYGSLEKRKKYSATFNDTALPLFGPRSILGRSLIIHRKSKNSKWACATIARGYSPNEASELRAIASFHHPQGFAYGYVRMTQLVYRDGSQSETVIEVNLRHPGKHDRNVTRNHNWAIYVNPVGVDAAVKVQETRCVAAGYTWNPYFTQLADPLNDDLYRQECGADLPLRCYVGDVSARLGPIDIGLERRVFTDPNFPLEGPVSAMGRSIVIFDKDFSGNRFACANIEPDNDIVKYANIRRPPRFVAAQFLEDVRKVMGIPEWMMSIDNRKTRILHDGACIQFQLHFKGPIVHKLEQDFSKLISTGRLDAPSLYIPGYVPTKRKSTLAHRQCGTRDPNDKNFNFFRNGSVTVDGATPGLLLMIIYLLLFIFM